VRRDIAAGRVIALPVDTEETRGAVGLTRRENAASNASLEILSQNLRSVVRGFAP
jgi:LysR family transcriptional regulator, pca operon transcriptional activator